MSQRWPGRILALGIAAASAAVMAVYAAAGFAAYVAKPLVVGRAQLLLFIPDEPQASNRTAKSDREALLLNSPSYTNFNPAFLAFPFSVATADRKSDVTFLNDAQIAGIGKRLRLSQRLRHERSRELEPFFTADAIFNAPMYAFGRCEGRLV